MSIHPISVLWRWLSFLTAAIAALYATFFVVSFILFPQVALTILLITIVSVKRLLF
jgi:hypothetical protein